MDMQTERSHGKALITVRYTVNFDRNGDNMGAWAWKDRYKVIHHVKPVLSHCNNDGLVLSWVHFTSFYFLKSIRAFWPGKKVCPTFSVSPVMTYIPFCIEEWIDKDAFAVCHLCLQRTSDYLSLFYSLAWSGTGWAGILRWFSSENVAGLLWIRRSVSADC